MWRCLFKTIVGLVGIAAVGIPTGTGAVCVGDCNTDNTVTVDEILEMVNIALGNAQLSTCMPGDTNGDGNITVDEILAAVSNALNGCGGTGGCQSNSDCSASYPYCGPDGNCWTQPCADVCSGGTSCCGGDYPYCGPDGNCWNVPCADVCSSGTKCCGGDYPYCGPDGNCWTQPCADVCGGGTSCCGGDYPHCGPDGNCWNVPCSTLCGDTCCGPTEQCQANETCS